MTGLVIASVAAIAGFFIGLVYGSRLSDHEYELAYLAGHVEGHRKGEAEGVPL